MSRKAADDRPTCRTCVFWRPLSPHVGLCTGDLPALGPLDESTGLHFGVWPATEKGKSCGRHQDMPAWIRQRAEANT